MSLVLYQMDVSPPCRAVLMLIHILGLKVELRNVDILAGEHMRPEYLEKNIKHTVPLLLDDNVSISDSHAILTYLVAKYGGDMRVGLYPDDVTARSKVNEMLFFEASILFPRVRAITASIKNERATGASEDQIASIEEAYGFVDKYLENSPYIAADHLTVADLSCVATFTSLNYFVPIDKKFSKIHEWLKRLKQTDFYKKGNDPGMANFDSFVKTLIKLVSM